MLRQKLIRTFGVPLGTGTRHALIAAAMDGTRWELTQKRNGRSHVSVATPMDLSNWRTCMTSSDPTTQAAVDRLAEAGITREQVIRLERAADIQEWQAREVLLAIAANPDILREYGIGRLPTRSELMACREVDASTGYPVRVFGDDAVDYLVEAGWAIEDPDPQPPEPTLREQVASMIQAGMDNGQYPDAIMRSLLAEFDITPKAAAEGDVSCG